ncbi:MAG: helix-turn-helix domain-containing protein [Oscillospiraceae bacterium]|nr:helix-turn-helix domain-containing protein [Oscillospiraceae bacterium]
MSERKNEFPEMLTAEDLQNFGFTRSMAYAFLNRVDVPVIKIGKRKFIRKEKFYEWLEEQERSGNKN